jgi:thiamine-monophosphate kinase
VAAPDGRVVATTDLMVEDRHFRREWSSAYDVGRKAAAASLADVVAMGARPTALIVGFATPAELPLEWADGLADGLRDEAALLGAAVVGGDIVRSDVVMIAVTALGDLAGREPITRAGARPGDHVSLAGWPGRAAAGLALLEAGHDEHPLAAAHRRPRPDYAAALSMVDQDGITAMIDISDGLVADLGHIAEASGVRIELTAADLPLDPAVVEAGRLLGVDPFDWIAGGGDDHCFAAMSPAGSANVPDIGRVVALDTGASPTVTFTDHELPTSDGYEHHRRS